MKKILLFIFMLLITIPVNGLEGNVTNVRKYKYYRLNKSLGPMVMKGEVNDDYPLVDENDYILTDLSEVSTVKPDELDGRKIYEHDGFHYLEIPKVSSLVIEPQHGTMLYDIEIRNTNGDVLYKDNDGSFDNSKSYKLKNETDLSSLVISLKGIGKNEKLLFTISFNNDDLLVGEIGFNAFCNSVDVYGKDVLIKSNAYKDIYSLEKLNLSDNLIYKGLIKLYQYQDYKYQSYRFEKEYYDEYLTEPFEDYIYRDEDDFIDVPMNNNENTNSNDEVLSKPLKNEKLKNEISTIIPNYLSKENVSSITNEDKTNSLALPQERKASPIQYTKTLKLNDDKDVKPSSTNLYYYFLLIFLIILLLIALRVKRKVKEYQRPL